MNNFKNVVDFHIHGIGSKYKDEPHASANYNQLCAYFQKMAEKENKNFVIAITEHDNSFITFDEYKKLSEKYPKVKIVLGMETNTKLTYPTEGLFEQAHILTYADMTSDETVKKWLDNADLKAMSKINRFTVKFPSNYYMIQCYVERVNKNLNLNLDINKIAKNFAHTELKAGELKKRADEIIAKDIFENKKDAFQGMEQKDISKILQNITTGIFSEKVVNEKLGIQLYAARNILSKYLDVHISNREIAMILDKGFYREQMREIFLKYVRVCFQKQKPELYNKVKNLSLEDFANYSLGENDYGSILLSSFFPKNKIQVNQFLLGSKEMRFRLSELNKIVSQTGGHLLLAHPNSKFEWNKNGRLTKKQFDLVDPAVMPKNEYNEIKSKFENRDSILISELQGYNQSLLKLDLLFKICKQKGINFEGYEITKSDLKNNKYLVNKLIYAAKHNMDVSFGSDTHLSNVDYYNLIHEEGKMADEVFDKLYQKAVNSKDKTAIENKFKQLYPERVKTEKDVKKHSTFVASKLKNNQVKYNASKSPCKVVGTSFADKMMGENNSDDYMPMLTIEYRGNIYEFEKGKLKDMDYNFINNGETKENDKDSEKEKTL